MKNLILTTLILSLGQVAFGQINEGLVDLGKAYSQFMFRNNPPATVLNSLDKYNNSELSVAADFIQEAIRPNNNILSETYLKRPADKDLRYIYIVRNINYNVRKENPIDNNKLIESLLKRDLTTQELVDAYYSMLFTAYGNKVNPYDMSAVDFQLNNYGLKDDTEKGIFFLQSMRLNGAFIFGFMNIVKPPNYSSAMELINKYPKYNGSPYYQFLDFNFPDFKMNIESETKEQSYKQFYINKYYETLLSNLDCLRETGHKEKINDLLLGSILKEEIYYKYSKREKELKKLFTKYKK